MNDRADDDPTLAAVRRAVDGDATALTLLLVNLHPEFCRFLQSRIPASLRSQLDPEDVLQESYVQVFRHIARFVPRGPDAFRRWVCTIALQRLRNELDKARAGKRGGGRQPIIGGGHPQDSWIGLIELLSASGRSPSRCVARDEAIAAVQASMTTLPDHYQEAIRLVYLEGWSAASAAAKMRTTERGIHGLCRRGLALLRRQLGSDSGFLNSGS